MYIIPRVTKTYFYTTKTKNRFPSEFIQSKNERKIIVISGKLSFEGFKVSDVKVHASFIERDHYDDYFCVIANDPVSYVKKYDYTSLKQDFEIWFTDMEGVKIDPDKVSFILELLLVY